MAPRTLEGSRAVVTGSASGIGRAIALELARSGSHVVIHAARSLAQAEEVAASARAFRVEADVACADLSDEASCRRFARDILARYGTIDIWVNNAGADVLTGAEKDLDTLAKLDLLYRVDLRATMLLTRLVGERMRARGRGVILNMGWDQAERGMEGESGEIFAAIKGAIMGFTRSAALSLAPAVRVNCLAPGWIRTAWGETASAAWQERALRETPAGRWGTAEDVAAMARFLASPEAEFITGQIVRVNGGAVR